MALYNRALLHMRTGQFREAVTDFSAILKKYPNFEAGYMARGEAKRRMGDYKGGDADYERTFPMFRGEAKPRGITYVTLGTAAGKPTKRENPDPSTARFVSARHYAAVKIVDRKLSVKVYSDKGKQLDSFDLYL